MTKYYKIIFSVFCLSFYSGHFPDKMLEGSRGLQLDNRKALLAQDLKTKKFECFYI